MNSPGVEVRPIRKSTGEAEFAEVFLNDVRIPVGNVVGEPNCGWGVAQVTLAAERGILVFEGLERQWHALMQFFKNALDEGAYWLEDDQLRREFMLLFGEVQANRHLVRQLLRENEEEGMRPSMTPALAKICFSVSKQRVSEFMTRLDDLDGQLIWRAKKYTDSTSMASYLDSYGHTIAGGSNEIMRNILAERGLGMPR
jgi:alkylation response protein AidB-like acyl-CoA dehydrogenase